MNNECVGRHFEMVPEETRSTSGKRISLARRGATYLQMSGPAEFIAAAVLGSLTLGIRIINMMSYRFDSDEPQHLHVIWGWARGFVQYRDLFDNHMPLFHIMFAPIYGLIGDRALILHVMRFVMLPLYFVAAWCTYQIGTCLFSKRAGIWAMIIVGLYPGYHFISLEFRTDNLWAPLWLLCVTVLVTGPLTVRRTLIAGLILGLCFGVSMKSTFFLFSIALAAPVTLFLVGRQKLGQSWSHLARCVAAFLIPTSIVPAIVMAFFALKGLWHDFQYCVFDFNLLARGITETSLGDKIHLGLTVAIAALVIAYTALWITRVSENPGLACRRAFLLIVSASYFFAAKIAWPVTSHDDNPPFYPLAAALCSGALLAVSNSLISLKWSQGRILRRMPLPAFVALAEIILLTGTRSILKDRTKPETELLREVLAVLKPGDYVLDCKGETVFRQRCVWVVFETITRSAIHRGLIVDNAPQRCVETRTCAVAAAAVKRLPRGTRDFVERNYLPVAEALWIAGQELKLSTTGPHRCQFKVAIPASYEIISPNQHASGTLDGTPYNGARFLSAGPHTFESTLASQGLILLWAQAVDRHFTPFEHHASHNG